MKFYDNQGSYSFKDIKHIKTMIGYITHSDKNNCSGWMSAPSYTYLSNKEYCIEVKESLFRPKYLKISGRYLDRIEMQNKNSSMIWVDTTSTPSWFIVSKCKIKIGFYKYLIY